MASVTGNNQGQFVPPTNRPTLSSATRASLTERRTSATSDRKGPTITSSHATRRSATSRVSHKPQMLYDKQINNKEKDWEKSSTAVGSASNRVTTPRGQKPQMSYGKPVKGADRDWTRKKTYPTRSKQSLNANLEFYQNKLQSKPKGHTIEEMLKWEKNYDKLEKNHRYIQWLFPLPGSRGMNPESQPLQEHEAEKIRSTFSLRQRVLRAYKMMLDFYGMQLVCKDTGEVARSKNWKPRYSHLNTSFHNYLRISRILKSLGCLGYEHFQYPWLQFILKEAVENKTLPKLDCGAVSHWIKALSSEGEQEIILEYYKSMKHGKVPQYMDVDIESKWGQEMEVDGGD